MTKLSKLIGSAALGLALLSPALALAQTSTTGILNVYVQVLNNQQYSNPYSPGNFTVAVSGQSPSITNFPGSLQGTLVTLSPGSYAVTIVNTQYGYTPTYSVGCNNTISAGGTLTCVVTMTAGSVYTYPTPYPYPYPYTQPALTCHSDTPVVALGQTARFTAMGGVGGTYNWTTGSQNYPNIGPVLTTTFQGSGSQSVTVTNASQTATCAVTVTTSYYPQPVNTPSTIYPGTPAYNTYPYQYPYQTPPTYSAYAYPRFPNTGIEPATSAQIAFALVLLMGAAIAAYPYVRKTFTLAVR